MSALLDYQAGVRGADARLLAEYRGAISGLCWRRRRSWIDVDDLIQEASHAFLRAALTYKPDGGASLVSWAWKPMGDAVFNWIKFVIVAHDGKTIHRFRYTEAPRDDGEEIWERLAAKTSTPEQLVSEMNAATEVARIIARGAGMKPHELRAVIRNYAGETYEEIGAERGVTKQAVEAAHKRAVMKARKWVKSLPAEERRTLEEAAA